MPTVSGRLIYDDRRTAVKSSSYPGIANVPIALQNTTTGIMLAVLTDANGNYSFNNVPNGNYQIVERYGFTPASPTPGNFTMAIHGNFLNGGVTPPISYVNSLPPGTTNLDCITPNTILITISGTDSNNNYILNGPVKYTPINTIMDSHVTILSVNLITSAANGTIGLFPAGTAVDTGAGPINPYSNVGTGFIYTQPSTTMSAIVPTDGEFTIQNIVSNSYLVNTLGNWWRIADHTTGNETGRMVIINGDHPEMIIFEENVTVKPNTYYLFSTWVFNLITVNGRTNPMLGVEVIDLEGNLLTYQRLNRILPPNLDEPEWLQIGGVIYSSSNTSLIVRFTSEGPAAAGNDYAIDDISLHEIYFPDLILVKTCSQTNAYIEDTVTYTVTLHNIYDKSIVDVAFQDSLPAELSFVYGSVKINGISQPTYIPNIGFPLLDIESGDTVTITYDAIVMSMPVINPIVNTATMVYTYTIVQSGIPHVRSVLSNQAELDIYDSANLVLIKTADQSTVMPGDIITYSLEIINNGPSLARKPLLVDNLPSQVKNAEYSIDNGDTWSLWTGNLTLSQLEVGASIKVLIQGTINLFTTGILANTASVNSSTHDPDYSNNISSVETTVENSADLAVVKTGGFSEVSAGDLLTYTLVVSNAGPSVAQNVILTDPVPNELSDMKFSIDNGMTWQDWTGSYSIGTLEKSSVVIMLIEGTVVSGAYGTIINTANVSSDTLDPNTANNSSTISTNVITKADLVIIKVEDANPVQPNDLLTYTINVINNGPSDAQNVHINDMASTSINDAMYSDDTGITWYPWIDYYNIERLISRESFSILIRGTVDSRATGTLTNIAIVSSDTPDPYPDNNYSIAITAIGTSADISVSKISLSSPATAGQLITYIIAVTNNGPDVAEEVVITDIIPPDLTDMQFSNDGGTEWQTWTGYYPVGSISKGSTISILIKGILSVTATGTIENTVTISSNTPDPDPYNNTVTTITPVGTSADLSINKTGPSSVNAGEQINYTIAVQNDGPNDSLNVILSDVVPSELIYVEYSTDGTIWQPWVGSYTIGTVMNGSTVNTYIRGTVSSNATGRIINTAIVTSYTPDTNRLNNSSTVTTIITVSSDLVITKSSIPNPAVAGRMITYSLVITNNGPSDARDVMLIDVLPSGILNAEFSTNDTTWLPWNSTYMIGNVSNGASVIIHIRALMGQIATETIINTATVSSSTPDPDISNNRVSENTPVTDIADLSITKDITSSPVIAGTPLTYMISIKNNGPSNARGVTFSDIVQQELSDMKYSIDAGINWNDWNNKYTFGTLANNATVTMLLRGTVNQYYTGMLINTAVASSETPDPDSSNNTATIETTVQGSADISVQKTANPSPVTAGELLTYTLTISNAGPSCAKNVIVTDTITAELLNVEYSIDNIIWLPWPRSYTIGSMDYDESVTLHIRGIVSSATTETIINAAVVKSDTPDPNTLNNTHQIATIVNSYSDLAITKTANSELVGPGAMLTYTLTVTNNGPSDAQDVVISDYVSANIINVQYSDNDGKSWHSWIDSYNLGTLISGNSFSFIIRGTVSHEASEALINSAIVSSSTPDFNTINNNAVEITQVFTNADLSINKLGPSAPVYAGQQITYTIVVKNNGPDNAHNVMIKDPILDELSNEEFSLDAGITWQPWTGSYSIEMINNGLIVQILIRGTVIPKASGIIANTANVTSDTSDLNITNNNAVVTTTIMSTADLSIKEKISSTQSMPGESLIYTITITNNGPTTAENVVLTDKVPAYLTNIEYSLGDEFIWYPWNNNLNLGTMENGDSINMFIRGTISPDANGQITNTVVVSSTTTDSNLANNTSGVTTRISKPIYQGPRHQAISDVIESVALQETALSHILNAEGEKIQAMAAINGVTAEELLALNKTASKLIESIIRLESVLQAKLDKIISKN